MSLSVLCVAGIARRYRRFPSEPSPLNDTVHLQGEGVVRAGNGSISEFRSEVY